MVLSVYYFILPPSDLLLFVNQSSYLLFLIKASIIFSNPDFINIGIMLATIFSASACYFMSRYLWRKIAIKCVSELYTSKSVTNRSIVIHGDKIEYDDYMSVISEIILSKSSSFAITGNTVGLNIYDSYNVIKNYIQKCRELEQIEKYRYKTYNNLYPPIYCCACCYSDSYYDKIKMEVEYYDRKISDMHTKSLSEYSKCDAIFVIFENSQSIFHDFTKIKKCVMNI